MKIKSYINKMHSIITQFEARLSRKNHKMRLIYGIVLVALFAYSSGLPAAEPINDGDLINLGESDFLEEGCKCTWFK